MNRRLLAKASALLCAVSFTLTSTEAAPPAVPPSQPVTEPGSGPDAADELFRELEYLLAEVDRIVSKSDKSPAAARPQSRADKDGEQDDPAGADGAANEGAGAEDPADSAAPAETDPVDALVQLGRHDARLVDLFAFTREENLVLILCLNPAVPPDVTEYVFSKDLTFEINIDSRSEVRLDDSAQVRQFGGQVAEPGNIRPSMTFRWIFLEDGSPRLLGRGMPPDLDGLAMFAGLRRDPFIRDDHESRNIVVLAAQIPLIHVLKERSTLLIWGTGRVAGLEGPFQSLAGRALRARASKNMRIRLNTLPPNRHVADLGVPPDVIIFDTRDPAEFPNGRDLMDDVSFVLRDLEDHGDDAAAPDLSDGVLQNVFPYIRPPDAELDP